MVKGKYVVLIVIILLLIVGGTRYLTAAKEKQTLKQDVKTHLSEEGYDESDIKLSYIVNMGEYSSHYVLVVTFSDEIGVEYFYGYIDGKIEQVDAVNMENEGVFKHLEKGIRK